MTCSWFVHHITQPNQSQALTEFFLLFRGQIRALEWPSLTVQWLPAAGAAPQGPCAHQGLLLGTHAAAGAQNALLVADVKLPLRERAADGAAPFLSVVERVPLPAPVCRARHMPQNARLVAVAMLGAGVALVRTGSHSQEREQDKEQEQVPMEEDQEEEGEAKTAVTRLDGCAGTEGTFGLSWAPEHPGTLLAGGLDGALCVWDVAAGTAGDGAAPKVSSQGAPVSDACFHPRLADVAGVVRGGRALLWDTRTAPGSSGGETVLGGSEEGAGANSTCVSFSAAREERAVTGDGAGRVLVWDARQAAAPVQRLCGHRGAVLQVACSEGVAGAVASTGADRRVLVWDPARAGRPQTPAERAEGPPELLFVHGGHTALVADLAWNPHDPLTLASVARDNILQLWQPASVL